MNKSKILSIFQGLTAFALWSTLGIFFNIVKLPTSTYVVFGSLIGLCVLLGYFHFIKGGIPKITLSPALLGIFVIAAVKGVIWFKALTLLPVAKAMLIHNLAPVIALMLAPILIKEKPSFNHLIAVITGFLGLTTLLKMDSFGGSLLQLGILFSISTAVASGLQDVLQRKLSGTTPGSTQALVFILGQAMGGLFFLLPQFPSSISWIDVSHFAYFGIVGTALPIILLSNAFAGLKSFEVATFGFTEPALGALWGSFFLKQAIEPSTAIGGLLIFLSGLTAIREESRTDVIVSSPPPASPQRK